MTGRLISPWQCVVCLLLLGIARSVPADHPLASFSGGGSAGPLSAPSAHPLPPGRTAVSVQAAYTRFDTFSDGALRARGEHAHSTGAVLETALSVVHGLSDRLDAGVRVTHVGRRDFREVRHDEAANTLEIESPGDLDGPGDTTLFARYAFNPGRSRGVTTLLAGLKAPTGRTRLRASDGDRLETAHQPGSGSWDGLLGLVHSRRLGPLSLDASVLASLTTEGAQDTRIGNTFSYNLALSRPVFDAAPAHDHRDGAHAHWSATIELNGEWRGRDEVNGRRDPDTGGHVLFVSPGLRVVSPAGYSAGISFGVSAISDMHGDQVTPDWRVLFSLGRTF